MTENKNFEYVWLDYYCAPQKERSIEEELIFERTLRYISHLFLGASVLILCDRTRASATAQQQQQHSTAALCHIPHSLTHSPPLSSPSLPGTYTTRFWTLFEAWLSMQMTSPNGLIPAPKDKRRCSIVPIHLASDLTAQELETLMAGKSVDEAYSTLDRYQHLHLHASTSPLSLPIHHASLLYPSPPYSLNTAPTLT